MKVLLGGVEYKIVFGYEETVRPISLAMVGSVHRGVTCELIDAEGKGVALGASLCHPKDNFCRETGRKLALTRAITGFNKAQRAAIWAVYLHRRDSAVRPEKRATAAGTPADVPPEGGFECCGGDLIHGHEVGCVSYDGGHDPEFEDAD